MNSNNNNMNDISTSTINHIKNKNDISDIMNNKPMINIINNTITNKQFKIPLNSRLGDYIKDLKRFNTYFLQVVKKDNKQLKKLNNDWLDTEDYFYIDWIKNSDSDTIGNYKVYLENKFKTHIKMYREFEDAITLIFQDKKSMDEIPEPEPYYNLEEESPEIEEEADDLEDPVIYDFEDENHNEDTEDEEVKSQPVSPPPPPPTITPQIEISPEPELKKIYKPPVIKHKTKDKLIFYDKVSVKNAKYVYSLSYDDFKFNFWDKKELSCDNNKYDLKTYFNSVKKYCEEVICNKVDGEDYAIIKKKYKYSTGNCGRIYVCGFGIQSLQNKIRKFLTQDYLFDIDIKSAHPTILYELVLEYNKSNPHDKLNTFYLENYVKNREEVLKEYNFDKMNFLINLNSDEIKNNKKDKGYYTKNNFLIGFHKEKTIIFNKILKNTDYVKKYDLNSNNEYNPISSKVNKILCIEENKLIQQYIKSDVCVPMFDGFLFDKKDKDLYDPMLKLSGLISWIYKENINEIDISDFKEEDCNDYQTLKTKFETKMCKIKSPLLYCCKIKDVDGKYQDVFYNNSDFTGLNADVLYTNEKGQEKPFTSRWYRDKNKRVYESFDFVPYSSKENDKTPSHIYNTFSGFKAKKSNTNKKPNWFLDYLYNDLGSGNEEIYNWLLKYTAHIIQHPEINPKVCLLLKGESGIGKDSYVDVLQSLFGIQNDYCFRTTDTNKVFPDKAGFNSDLENKLIVQFNETKGVDGYKIKEQLKDQITAERNNIRKMRTDSFPQKNYARFIVLTNNNSSLNFMWDERKICMIKASAKHKGDTDYWNDFHNNRENQEKMDELYTYLLNYDIGDFDFSRDRPKTKEYLTELSNAIPSSIRFLKESIEQDCCIYNKTNKGLLYIKAKRLYTYYNKYLTENFILDDGKFKSNPFKKELQNLEGVEVDKSIKINGSSSRYITINREMLNKTFEKYTWISNLDEAVDVNDL